MSDTKYFERAKAAELKAEWDAFESKKPAQRLAGRRLFMKRIVANLHTDNQDMVNLFPEVMETLQTDPSASDLGCRKMCYKFLEAHGATRWEATLDYVPELVRTVQGGTNPSAVLGSEYSRCLALRCLSGLKIPAAVERLGALLAALLGDENALVRKTACFAAAKVFDHDPKVAERYRVVALLNDALSDTNAHVVASALAVLEEITAKNQTMNLVISDAHVRNLLVILHRCNEWSQCYILSALTAYVPQIEDDALFVVERMVPLLQHANTAIVLGAVKCIFFLSNYVGDLVRAIPVLPKRVGHALVALLAKPPALQFLVLRNVILAILAKPHLVEVDVALFFCRYDDTLYVKDTKLEIIYLLATPVNLGSVLRELEEYAMEVDTTMARKAIRAIGNLAIKLPKGANASVQLLLDLVAVDLEHITEEAIVVFKNVLRRYPSEFDKEIEGFLWYANRSSRETDGDSGSVHVPVSAASSGEPAQIGENNSEPLASLIWIVGQYASSIPHAVTMLSRLTSGFTAAPTDVQLVSLTSAMRAFLSSPSKAAEQLVLSLLKQATEKVDSPDVRERGIFYWRLLSSFPTDPSYTAAKHVVLAPLPVIATDGDKLDRNVLDELELNIGTLASIYLKPVRLVFRLSRAKLLPLSPCLVRQKAVSELEEDLVLPVAPINDPALRMRGHKAREIESDDENSKAFVGEFRKVGMGSASSLGKAALSGTSSLGKAAISGANRSLTRTTSILGRKLTMKKGST